MRDHLSSSAWFFGVLACVPLAMGFIGAWSGGLGFLLFVIGAPLLAILLVFGGVVLTFHGGVTVRQTEGIRDRLIVALAAPVMIGMTIVLAWPLLDGGRYLGTLSRLAVNRSAYQAIIESLKCATPVEGGTYREKNGITYITDSGPPIRVAFNPSGMLDNWSGIIFDPTGEVIQADGFDSKTGKFYAPDRITKLFGGDLLNCRHLFGDYYSCAFT